LQIDRIVCAQVEIHRTMVDRLGALLVHMVRNAVDHGIETESERVSGKTERVLEEQLQPVLAGLTAETATKVILAYEPVWAIGTGKVASLKDIQETHQHIQKVWASHNLPGSAVILYGGSVNPTNFAEILALKEVHGALVGGASIKLDQWLELIKIAEATAV
jgi:triosephosphate isomerase